MTNRINKISNFVHYKLEKFIDHHEQKNLQQDLNSILEILTEDDTLLVTVWWNTVDPSTWSTELNQLLVNLTQIKKPKKIILLFDCWYKNFNWDATDILVDKIVFFDFFLLSTYLLLDYKKINPVSTQWNSTSRKFLFLTGKPSKIHRTRLLYKFDQVGLLKQATWSFFVTDITKKKCQEYLPELSDDEFEMFVNRCQKTQDLPELANNFDTQGYSGLMYDIKLYSESLFTVTSETYFDRLYTFPSLTEKTWTRIANCVPIIMAGEYNSLGLMEHMGFNTFREFLPVPNYDNPESSDYLKFRTEKDRIDYLLQSPSYREFYQSIRDPSWPEFELITQEFIDQYHDELLSYSEPILSDSERRLDFIVYNCKYWLDNLHKQSSKVNQLVVQNRNRYLELGQQEADALTNVFEKNKLDCSAIEFMVNNFRV